MKIDVGKLKDMIVEMAERDIRAYHASGITDCGWRDIWIKTDDLMESIDNLVEREGEE